MKNMHSILKPVRGQIPKSPYQVGIDLRIYLQNLHKLDQCPGSYSTLNASYNTFSGIDIVEAFKQWEANTFKSRPIRRNNENIN